MKVNVLGKTKSLVITITGFVAIGIISIMTFATWKTINVAVDDLLGSIGLSGVYLKWLAIIIIGLSLLFLLHFVNKKVNLFDSIKDVLKL